MAGPLLVIDAPFLLYRSFFALPDSITGTDDHAVNALLGATNATLRVAADRAPRAIVMCFGAEAATYRVELYPDYHAARPPVPDPLAWQFEQAPRFFEAFGWTPMTSETLEADDLLGSLARIENEAGGETMILTGDRDMYQCVSERVKVWYLKSGTTGFEEVDAREVRKRYGISPELVPDFIALRGDPSDGLPGAPGVGPKTAAELLERHGSLEAAIAGGDPRASPRHGRADRERRRAARVQGHRDAAHRPARAPAGPVDRSRCGRCDRPRVRPEPAVGAPRECRSAERSVEGWV